MSPVASEDVRSSYPDAEEMLSSTKKRQQGLFYIIPVADT